MVLGIDCLKYPRRISSASIPCFTFITNARGEATATDLLYQPIAFNMTDGITVSGDTVGSVRKMSGTIDFWIAEV
jgi:hypothetical protein